ncbi:MAG: GyrI-like domain-containing protein [Lachnotalea sp.]
MIHLITSETVNHAIDYIMQHIGEDILIEDVADYCHFSKYYFSRIFKEETGTSIYAFIKKVKLEQSAFRLKVEQGTTVTDIGFDYGYSPSNYSSVFKQYHNDSPVGFRKKIYERSMQHPFYPNTVNRMESFEECNQKISIETMEDQYVIYERRIGNYHNLEKDWCEFLAKYKEYRTDKTLLLECTFDDVSITNVNSCLYDIYMSVDKGCTLKNTCTIRGGKFAVYHFKGFPPQIYAAYQNMFNIWIPMSNQKIDKRYGFDCYREINCETMYMVLDIYIPIE